MANETPIVIGNLPDSRGIPRVSIGLPVYNGERYLRESIDSILAQTFQDFELVVCDNASTDATARICEEYAERDPRVRYFRNERNIGGINNANLTFERSRGELFRWAAHDDVCAPALLERCVQTLDERADAVGVYPGTINIDEDGIGTGSRYGKEGTATRPHARFRELSYRYHPCEPIYGVIRSEVLRKTRLQQNYTGSDRALLCELALHGPFVQIPEPLFYKRYHRGNQYKDWRGRMAWSCPICRSPEDDLPELDAALRLSRDAPARAAPLRRAATLPALDLPLGAAAVERPRLDLVSAARMLSTRASGGRGCTRTPSAGSSRYRNRRSSFTITIASSPSST